MNTLVVYQTSGADEGDHIINTMTAMMQLAGGATVIGGDEIRGVWIDDQGQQHIDTIFMQEVFYEDVFTSKMMGLIDQWAVANFVRGEKSVLYKLNGSPIFRYAPDSKTETPADNEAETPVIPLIGPPSRATDPVGL